MSSDCINAVASGFPGLIVALGANLGDPILQLREAAARLASWARTPIRCSSIWETTPVDCPPGSPVFANAIALVESCPVGDPLAVLDQFQSWEIDLGRTPKRQHNQARPLDLDLIAWGGTVLSLPRLILPHPRAQSRRFVLQPLDELLPDLILPGWNAPVRELLAALPADPSFRRWVAPEQWAPCQ